MIRFMISNSWFYIFQKYENYFLIYHQTILFSIQYPFKYIDTIKIKIDNPLFSQGYLFVVIEGGYPNFFL